MTSKKALILLQNKFLPIELRPIIFFDNKGIFKPNMEKIKTKVELDKYLKTHVVCMDKSEIFN